jgi:hypothetical protein
MDPNCVVFVVDIREEGITCDDGKLPLDPGDEKSGFELGGTDSSEASVV